jgi:protein gp37
MAENSKIEWTDHTFNPWIGCTKVSPGCDNCYAATQDSFRKWTPEGWGGPRKRTKTWDDPKKWNDAHSAFFAQHGRRQRVFCASLADVFDNEVPNDWRLDLFALIVATPNLDWLLLTKRIGNVKNMVADIMWKHLPHVWLGATIVNQEEADRDIPKLLATPAAVRFLSMEPLLGPVDLPQAKSFGLHGFGQHAPGVDWVICGGESGPKARPMYRPWVVSLRDQCAAAGVPFLFKQWGEWLPGEEYTPELQERDSDLAQSKYQCAQLDDFNGHDTWDIGYFACGEVGEEALFRVGKKAAGRELYGVTHDGFPALDDAPPQGEKQ